MRKKRNFYKSGLNKRESNFGLTNQQLYHIYQGIVLPLAIKNGNNLTESQNMMEAMIVKYGKYTKEERLAFTRLAKKKYLELLENAGKKQEKNDE